MSTSYYSLTVVFKEEIREEGVKHIIDAIKMIKGVMNVVPHVADSKFELLKKIYELLGSEG